MLASFLGEYLTESMMQVWEDDIMERLRGAEDVGRPKCRILRPARVNGFFFPFRCARNVMLEDYSTLVDVKADLDEGVEYFVRYRLVDSLRMRVFGKRCRIITVPSVLFAMTEDAGLKHPLPEVQARCVSSIDAGTFLAIKELFG